MEIQHEIGKLILKEFNLGPNLKAALVNILNLLDLKGCNYYNKINKKKQQYQQYMIKVLHTNSFPIMTL